MAFVGTVWHELFFMKKRGPKPPDFGSLNCWEFEFYKVFHLLRDGTSLPARYATPSSLSVEETRKLIGLLTQLTGADHYLTTRRVAREFGENVVLKKPPTGMDIWWAENQLAEELYWLRSALKPRRIEAQNKRRRIWNDLVQANTYASLRKACGRWARLPDVRGGGLVCFPAHIIGKAAAFLSMKQNRRFPRSNYGDNSRLEYLARGMAGAVLGMSPMTAIERLRNMKHTADGPLWIMRNESYSLPINEQYCGCWRCRIKKSNEAGEITRTAYENGLKLFCEVANSTKTPTEWRRIRPTWTPAKRRI
jgi:hypothetical protein